MSTVPTRPGASCRLTENETENQDIFLGIWILKIWMGTARLPSSETTTALPAQALPVG
jgi:hypothetical protein